MDDLEKVTNDETIKIFRNGKNKWLRDGLLGFIGSTALCGVDYVNNLDNPSFNLSNDIYSYGGIIAATTILAYTGVINYIFNKYTILKCDN